MGVSLQFKVTYGGDREIGVLQKLIAKRVEMMHESANAAVIGTTLICLRSLRAATEKAHPGRVTVKRLGASIAKADWESWHGKPHRVVRMGGRVLRNVRLTEDYKTPDEFRIAGRYAPKEKVRLSVFVWIPVHRDCGYDGMNDPVYIVADKMSKARQKAKNIEIKRAKQYQNMARRAWTEIMRKIFSQSIAAETISGQALTTLDSVLEVRQGWHGATFSLYAKDGLSYAADALQGGPSMVNACLQRASNVIAARMRQYFKTHETKMLDANISNIDVPFPEIARRRK